MTILPLQTLLRALVAAGAATVASLFVYAAVQQTYRSGADDPQVQMADDAAVALRAGAPAEAVVPRDTVDLALSLRPFVIVYDRDDRPLAGSGRLNGALPVPPAGVLDRARASGRYSVTWQPRRAVRIASVLWSVGDDGRVVLAGRSLREIELRESRLHLMSALAWGALLVASVVAALL
jgi:hypothetical protein